MRALIRGVSAACAVVGAGALLFSQWAAAALLFLAAALFAFAARID